MSRIIAGQAGGARLSAVRGEKTRPTTDRVKESLFSRLEGYGVIQGAHVADLFAGSGALGLEAASRGAAHVTLVDPDRAAQTAIRANARVLARAGVVAAVEIHARTAAAQISRWEAEGTTPLGLVFLDPPYALGEAELSALMARLPPLLVPDAVLVVERSSRSPEPQWPEGLERFAQKTYGETALWYAEPSRSTAS